MKWPLSVLWLDLNAPRSSQIASQTESDLCRFGELIPFEANDERQHQHISRICRRYSACLTPVSILHFAACLDEIWIHQAPLEPGSVAESFQRPVLKVPQNHFPMVTVCQVSNFQSEFRKLARTMSILRKGLPRFDSLSLSDPYCLVKARY